MDPKFSQHPLVMAMLHNIGRRLYSMAAKLTEEQWRAKLTPEQFKVLRQKGSLRD